MTRRVFRRSNEVERSTDPDNKKSNNKKLIMTFYDKIKIKSLKLKK